LSTDGTYSITADGADADGNAAAQAIDSFEIDTTVGANTITIESISNDTGTVGDFKTTDTNLTVSGSLANVLLIDETLQISTDGGVTWVNVSSVTGTSWTHDDTANTRSADFSYQLQIVDNLGNTGATATQAIEIQYTPTTDDAVINSIEDNLVSIVLVANDSDGSIESFSLNELPVNGTLYLDSAMTQEVQVGIDYSAVSEQLTVYFKPTDHWAGNTSLEFAAKDEEGLSSNTSTVTINVAPDADAPNLYGPSKVVELVDLSGNNGNEQNGVVDITNGTITLNSEDDNNEASPADIESGLGLSSGTLDSLAETSSATKAVDGSFYQKTFYAQVGDTLTFNWDFIDPESAGGFNTTVFNDYAIVVINGQPVVLESTNDNDQGVATYSYTVTETGPLSLGFAVVNVGDNQYDSQLIISDLELSGINVPIETVDVELNLASSLVDLDGSESLVVTLSGFPEGTQFSEGSLVGSNWVIDLGTSSLDGLTMTLPANAGAFDLQVTSTSTDSDGSNADSSLTIPVTLLDASSAGSAQVGLQGNYYGFNRVEFGNNNIESISEARTVINNQSVDATFTATTLDYGSDSNSGDLARSNHLQEFLKDDASSLSRDPGNNEHALLHMEGKIYLTEGTYGIQVTADDGYQILIDGQSVAEYNGNQGAQLRNPDSPQGDPNNPLYDPEQNHVYFDITDAGAHDIEIIYWDQGGGYRFLAEITDDNGATYETLDDGYLRSSETDATQLIGDDSSNELVGLLVDDDIFGQAGNDTIIGNSGNDYMSGGDGSDTFTWMSGDEGTVGSVASDVITDFQVGSGGDVLNLSDLLIDEENNSLDQFLHFTKEGNDTVVEVSPDKGSVTQKITLQGVDLTTYGDDSAIITKLISDGNLDVDS
ncbi:type I secretion C-terminal target domain-containing protein, partial [Litoribacillus peritrichatus]|uniref:type I secretion C-terminal target domain-containing protein n=1 Tax=Litoribacillus peritrichatus TaxID=718191 RepID=UPI0031E03899